ncbi:MAG: cell wall hydrolase/autolysin [Marmoricola sp.]|nr:cell wall hydrolase/autolysin [Marmoricola sp.]
MKGLLRALGVVVAVTLAGVSVPSVWAPSVADSMGAAPIATAYAPTARTATSVPVPARKNRKPLRSVTIALDPGHQLGNHNYPRQINAPVPAGGFTKPCNTTGTATDSGVAESTVNLQLAKAVKKRLRRLGARVPMTRTVDSQQKWGPCVDQRGEFGRRVGARLMVSLHADGASSSAHGFHVIAPTSRRPWTDDIAAPSLRLATSLRNALTSAGVARSSYIGHGTGLDVRSDLGTLNMSDVPVAMIEIGNMRNTADARRITSKQGRAQYAKAVVRGIRAWLGK